MAKQNPKNTFEITLSDGTKISDLTMNGNNFVSKKEISEDVFTGKLNHVIITGPEEQSYGLVGEHDNMELIQIMKLNDEYLIALREIPQSELEMSRLQGNIAYLSMMSDIDLD